MARTSLFIRARTIRNYLINGSFLYWQRGASFSTPANGSYIADRWAEFYNGSGTFTISRQAFALGQTEVPRNPTYFLRYDMTVAGSGTTSRYLVQKIEDVTNFSGGKMTISFYARAAANMNMTINAAQIFNGSPFVNIAGSSAITITPAWKKYSFTFDVPSIAGKSLGSSHWIEVQLTLPFNAIFTFDLANVMVNEGHEAAEFQFAGGDPATEFRLCERYYEIGSYFAGELGGAGSFDTGDHRVTSFRTKKRATPSLTRTNVSLSTSNLSGSGFGQDLGLQSVTPDGFRQYTRWAGNGWGNVAISFDWQADAEL